MKIFTKKLPILILLAVIGLGAGLWYRHGHPSVPKYNKTIPAEATTVAANYIKARESAVDSSQANANAWLDLVKPLTSSPWFAQLQQTRASPDYEAAHGKGLKVTATVSGCTWNEEATKSTTTEGVAICNLTDTTVDVVTGKAVPAASLPGGWSRNGPQTPVQLRLIYQKGAWLVSQDLTGQAG